MAGQHSAAVPSINFTVTALRFFFTMTLDRADAIKHLTFVAEPRKESCRAEPQEVARFLEAVPGVKYKAAFSAAYGAGLRVSQVAALKVSDIDSERMLLRIEQGKAARIATRCSGGSCARFGMPGALYPSRIWASYQFRKRLPIQVSSGFISGIALYICSRKDAHSAIQTGKQCERLADCAGSAKIDHPLVDAQQHKERCLVCNRSDRNRSRDPAVFLDSDQM